MSNSLNLEHYPKELETDFSWLPAGSSQDRNLKKKSKQHFDRHVLQQPFKRRGSLSASVQRHLGLDNLALMLGHGWNDDKTLTVEQRQAAKDQIHLAAVKRALKLGGGAPRGLITQAASVDDLKSRYFQPRAEPKDANKDRVASSTPAHPEKRDVYSSVCQRCCGINAENLSGGRAYVHSTLARLTSSGLKCQLCRLILDMMGVPDMGLTLTRYRIALTIEERSQFLDIQDRCINVKDPFLDMRNHLSEMTIQLHDLTPWKQRESELLEYDGTESRTEYEVERCEDYVRTTDASKVSPAKEESDELEIDQDRSDLYTRDGVSALQARIVRSESGLRCFTEEHDAARGLVRGIGWIRLIGATTASSKSFEVAANWLQRCLAEDELQSSTGATYDHREPNYTPPSSPRLLYPFNDDGAFVPECSRANEARSSDAPDLSTELPDIREELPSRLLEINEDATHIQLIETHGHQFPYVALSYCWGKDDGGEWKTTTRTILDHITIGLRSERLPLTLQHSLTITRRLAISYIWIDALCIVQDSADDWAKEAAKMAGVYFGSVLTIAASGARSWSDGCFNLHSKRIIERGPYSNSMAVVNSELSTGEISRLYVLSTDALRFGDDTDTYYHGVWERYHRQLSGVAYSKLVHGSPLATRGWTFQEHQLPRRTLYYTSEQLFWECEHCRYSEDNFPIQQDLRKHPVLANESLTSDAFAELWYIGIVEDYSRRTLTFTKDKLIAVSALAKATYLRRPQPYIAGIWRESIMHGLMWRRNGLGSKLATSLCPSWSWASQDSAIQYLWTKPGIDRARNWLSDYKPVIENVDYVSSPVSPFTDALSASVNFKTLLSVGTVIWHSHRRNGGQNVQGDSGWSQHTSIAEATYEYVDGGYKLAAELEQSLYISSANTDTIWYLEAAMDNAEGFHARVAVAYIGLDNIDTALTDDLGPEENNNNLVFLLLDPPDLNATKYRRVGIARFRSPWARPTRGNVWRLSGHIKEHPLASFREKTIRVV